MVHIKSLLLAFALLTFLNQEAGADTIESAAAFSNDTNFKKKEWKTNYSKEIDLGDENPNDLIITAGYMLSNIERTSDDSVLAQQWDGKSRINQHGGNLSVLVPIGSISGLNLGLGASKSSIQSSKSRQISGFHWFRSETLKVQVSYQKSESTQKTAEVIDVDVARVRTKDSLQGESYSLDLTHLTTPTTILLASYFKSVRNDRPDAWGGSIGVRQFIKLLNGAAHINYSHYENIGEIETTTLQGEIIADALSAEWHQKLYDRAIVTTGYRYYTEREDPRAIEAPKSELGSDWVYAKIAYHYGFDLWTEKTSEVYLFGGRYQNSKDIQSTQIGLGIRQLIN